MKKSRLSALLLTAALAAITPFSALAAGTTSGTSISNKATINYTISTIPQTLIESSPTGNSIPGINNGSATAFVVDDKVNVVIASGDATFVTTTPGSSAIALKFTVENTGNTTHDFALNNIIGLGNDFIATSIKYYADTDGLGTYNTGDLEITKLDNLAVDTPTVVFLVAEVPLTAINGNEASYALKAIATDESDIPLIATSGVDTASVDIVLADIDSDGAATDDTATNGIYVMWAGGSSGLSDQALGYKVSSTVLTVSKTSAVYSDPINNTTNPKAIPGAIVTYTITITNAAAAGVSATDVSISDSLNAEISAIPSRLSFNAVFDEGTPCGANEGILVDSVCNSNGSDTDSAEFTAGNVVNVTGLTLAPDSSATIKFQVTIQ